MSPSHNKPIRDIMKPKSLRAFIRENRTLIDINILLRPGMRNYNRKFNDEDRRGWILNDECPYLWARSEGVKL